MSNLAREPLRRRSVSYFFNQVALLLVECFGGIASGGARLLRYLARRASDKKRGRDGTKYSKFHPRGYLSHHLAAAAVSPAGQQVNSSTRDRER